MMTDYVYLLLVIKEYIVILVCNGKHQYQAREDLEAFLGNDSEKFVAWYCNCMSIISCILQFVHL